MTSKINDKEFLWIVIVLVAIVLALIQMMATGIAGETDSIAHYEIARYAFKYPQFFLDHWGKPLYTILAAPFAQLGYTGAIAFNLLCGLLTGWLASLIAGKLGYRLAWAAVIFTVFTPMYLFIMYSSLTEILFSLVLVAAIYLFISKRFIWSAIMISLIPYARTEGVMFLVLFIPALLMAKQYRALPFLLTGFVLFGLLGWPYYGDFLWFFTKMPYSMTSSQLYGGGSFWFYFKEMDYMVNSPLLLLIIIGLVFIVLDLKKGLKSLGDIRYITLYILIIPGLFGFILAQSYLWWKGLGILASLRFMTCVLPLAAIIALAGFDWMMERLKSLRILQVVFGIFILWLTVSRPFSDSYRILPMKPGPNNAVMAELADWLKSSPYSNRKSYFTDPLYTFYRDMNPHNQEKCFRVYSYAGINPSSLMKPGELLIWDPQFAGYEGRLPFDSLENNKNLRLLKLFRPKEPFTVIGGEEYRLAVFMRALRDTNRTVYQVFYFNDFESTLLDGQKKFLSTEFASSGKNSMLLNPDNIYSPSLEDKLVNLPDTGWLSLRASARILNPGPVEPGNTLLVFSIENANHKILQYSAVRDTIPGIIPGTWFELTQTVEVDRNNPPGGIYKAYVWYTGNNRIFVDDLKLEFMPSSVR